MTRFDGSNFQSIDEAGIGDGTGGSTQGLDAGLEHLTWNNEKYLRQNLRRGVSWSPHAGKELFAPDWTCLWMSMWPLTTTLSRLSVDLLLRFQSAQDLSQGVFDTRLRILDAAAGSLLTESSSSHLIRTGSGQPTEQYISTELTFSEGDIESQRWALAFLEFENQGTGDNGFATLGTYKDPAPFDMQRDGVLSSAIDADIPLKPNTAFRFKRQKNLQVELHTCEALSRYEEGDGTSGDPVPAISTPIAYRAHNDIQPGEQGYLVEHVAGPRFHLQGLNVREEHREDLQLSSRDMAGDVPYESQRGAYRHIAHVNDTYRRPRPLSIGWNTEVPEQDSHSAWRLQADSAQQPMHFGYHFFNQGGNHPTNCYGRIKPGLESQQSAGKDLLDVRFFATAVHLLRSYTRGADPDLDFETFRKEDVGELRFDLAVRLLVGKDQPNTKVAERTVPITLDLYPSDRTGRWHLLQCMYLMNWADNDSKPSGGGIKYPNGNSNWCYNEGLLKPRDYGLLEPQRVTLRLEDGTLQRREELQWEFEVTNLDSVTYAANDNYADNQSREHLAVAFMHPSIFQQPD